MDEQQRKMAEELLFSDKKSLSFGKRLYFGAFEPRFIFPYPVVSPEEEKSQSDYLKKVQEYVDSKLDPVSIDRKAEIPPALIKGLGDIGVLGMSIPTKYDGLGMSQHAYVGIVQMIAGRCSSTALLINAHQSIGVRALLLFGTEEQRKRWLAPLARGEQIAAFSLTEPNAGSDASGIETRAVYDPVKHVYRINGRKQWTTNGSIASVLTVMAKTEIDTSQGKQDKVTAFLVTPEMVGFKVVAPALEKVGMRGTRTTNLEFHDMEVPEANVLGPVGGGLRVCLTVLDYGRTTFGAMCTGVAKFLVDYAVKHARTRIQFQRPLAAFGLVKKKIAKMAALTYAMDASTYITANLIDQGFEDIMLESAMLKVFASEALWEILYDTMQIYGGRSFFTDHPLERIMRDIRLNMIGEGSNEVMRVFIGAAGMRDVGVDLKSSLDGNQWGKIMKQMFARLRLSEIPVSSSLHREATKLSRAVRRFGWAIIRLLSRYKQEIVDQQLELERIADSAIAIYTAAAVLSKLEATVSGKYKAQNQEQDMEAGKLYLQMAFETIDKQLGSIFKPNDRDIERLSDRMTGFK